MKIKILGNGGAINDGLPYNSFLIDDKYLIESPPDIMNSLFREKTDISKIRIIYISHFHGDHYFGLPLLLLRLMFNSISTKLSHKIKILGPGNIKNKTLELCNLALGETHPLYEWIETNIEFYELILNSEFALEQDLTIKIFPMFHFIETWGFSVYVKNDIVFSYFADTLWDDGLINQIKLFPKVIIADLNGESTDPVKVHLSENDIIEKALPVSRDRIIFYGTHLKYQKESLNENIRYACPGEEIIL